MINDSITLPFGGGPTKAKNQSNGCKGQATSFFRKLAKEVGLNKDQYSIRYNACGDWGEVMFHTDRVYIQANFDRLMNDSLGVMGRTCKGRKDYTGGPNQWIPVSGATLTAVTAFYNKINAQ